MTRAEPFRMCCILENIECVEGKALGNCWTNETQRTDYVTDFLYCYLILLCFFFIVLTDFVGNPPVWKIMSFLVLKKIQFSKNIKRCRMF